MREGDDRCRLAIEMEAYRLKKYIGSYFAAIGGADAVVFTAGVGEFSPVIRAKALEGLECLGIKLDHEKNNVCCCRNSEFEISADDSKVKILVVPTDEEIVFIEDVVALLQGRYKDPSEYVYDFQKPDYVNRQRAMAFEEDLKKNPALAKVSLHCKES
jgi:acetate kinase